MEVVDTTQINSFAPIAAQTDFPVSPSEEAVFILNSGQLSALITQAVQKALQPLQDEVRDLKATVACQDEKINALEATSTLQEENQLIQLRLIHDLREATKKEPGKTEISRADKIERYLSSRPDHRATFEMLKGHLQVDNVRLNEAIKTLIATSDRTYSIQKEKTGDKRKRILVMLPR